MTQGGTQITEGEGGWLRDFDEDIPIVDAIARTLTPLGYKAGKRFRTDSATCLMLEPLQAA